MGVSFKVSRKGTRFRPKPCPVQSANSPSKSDSDDSEDGYRVTTNKKIQGDVIKGVEGAKPSIPSGAHHLSAENEISFTLSLFGDVYCIERPSKNEIVHQDAYQDMSKVLRPYDRASEALFTAIECGHLPVDILDGIPCKYVNGTILCEVRDYRSCASDPEHITNEFESPIVHKVCLKMSLENVVKDISLISDSSWTYSDLLEAESRMLKALHPRICLDPTPNLDKLFADPVLNKLNLDSCSLRKKRSREVPEISVAAKSMLGGKKVCIDRSFNLSNGAVDPRSTPIDVQDVHVNKISQNSVPTITLAERQRSLTPNSSTPPTLLVSNQSRHPVGSASPRNMQERGTGSILNHLGSSPTVKNMIAYADNVTSGASLVHGKRENQDGQLSPSSSLSKKARLTTVALDSIPQQLGHRMDGLHGSNLDWKNAMLPPQPIGRGFQYSNSMVLNQDSEMSSFSAGQVQKRISMQNPRMSGVPMAPSPLSSKSGELGHQFGPVPPVGGTPLISSVNDGTKQHLNVNSPNVGTGTPLADQTMLERFSKIQMCTTRHGLNCKKNKVDNYQMVEPNKFSAKMLSVCLSSSSNNENYKDESMPLSKSLIGGNVNSCKKRIMNFTQQDRIVQGNDVSVVVKERSRLTMAEKLNDGTVAMYCGEIDDDDFSAAEDYLPILPNAHFADMFATQYCSLMARDGFFVEDHLQLKPTETNLASVSRPHAPMVNPNNNNNQGAEMQQYAVAAVNNQPSNTQPQNHISNIQQQLLPNRFQKAPMGTNTLSHVNAVMQNSAMMGNQIANKPSHLQLQMLQQQQQMQRKMIMEQGNAIRMGNPNPNPNPNLVGSGGRAGVSEPVGSISGVGSNMGQKQNPMNLNQANISHLLSQLRSGALTPAQAAILQSKLRMQSNLLGGVPQSSFSGMSGARQMNPTNASLSMFSQPLNHTNLNPMQLPGMRPMGPPKLMTGMNQQQQFQLQQQHQQQKEKMQQQETASPLQAVLSPSQVRSPQQLNQQQQTSSQQISQRTSISPQISSGAMASPASPFMSSQTPG